MDGQAMTATVNLTALAETRSKMTPGEFRYAGTLGVIESPEGGQTPYLPKSICEMFSQNAAPNAAGIVATHNAADALIEMARTLLVYNAAKREAARCPRLGSNDWDSDALQTGTDAADRVLRDARAQHDAALAKVSL